MFLAEIKRRIQKICGQDIQFSEMGTSRHGASAFATNIKTGVTVYFGTSVDNGCMHCHYAKNSRDFSNRYSHSAETTDAYVSTVCCMLEDSVSYHKEIR